MGKYFTAPPGKKLPVTYGSADKGSLSNYDNDDDDDDDNDNADKKQLVL